jgi:hypothetical protein
MPPRKRSAAQPASTENSAVTRRLDALLALLVQWLPPVALRRSVEDQSITLARLGLRPTEIANLTGRQRNNISRDISKGRKAKRLPRSK